ncbi:MAG: response regulator transcription factor [Planctomycetota bacterium]
MKTRTVLVVEDDAGIRQGIVDAATFEGYQPLEAADGETALRLVLSRPCDLVLLDLALPGRDGLEVLREVRRLQPTMPVIVITARGAEDDRVQGLRLGADDYVVKPFSVKELLARMAAVLRRSPERPRNLQVLRVPGGRVDLSRQEISFDDGVALTLSERERELLHYLASQPGRVISRNEILTRVWRLDPRGVETRTIDMHVARLREKLRDDPLQPRVIVTVRGQGYRFQGEESAS